jgi:NAD+ synthetase
LRKDFLKAQWHYLDEIAKNSPIPAIIGAAEMRDNHLPFNAAFLCSRAGIQVIGRKLLLPNYNVFDEKRYFSTPTDDACAVFTLVGKQILLSICEDAWNSLPLDGEQRYDFDPIKNGIAKHGPVDVIVNISASPYTQTKPSIRERIFTHVAKAHNTPVVMVGQVGANDQWLFDGHSLVIDRRGAILERASTCSEDLLLFDTDHARVTTAQPTKSPLSLLHDALVMGIRDYVEKCRLPGVMIGLSGGIDSAVVTALAVRALGARRVKAVYLPSRFSNPQSYEDAYSFASKVGIKMECLLIEDIVQSLRDLLADAVAGSKNADIFDQNLQARLRGLIIMALTNISDYIMLATSNKSELAVGYSTIYGDMCGALSPIGDLYKTEVYRLAKEINRIDNVIPKSILKRPPTAELKADQLDEDSLPNYNDLDRILFNFIDCEKDAEEIMNLTKLDLALINQIISMVNRAEYKRRQGPFPLMVSDKVFGEARRLPIARHTFPLANEL